MSDSRTLSYVQLPCRLSVVHQALLTRGVPPSVQAGPRQRPGVPVNATGAEEDEDDIGSMSDASVAEGSHANALALSKIREALKGLSQEDLQSLVKGTSVTRPLQLDDRAAATAALDLTVTEYLFDAR